MEDQKETIDSSVANKPLKIMIILGGVVAVLALLLFLYVFLSKDTEQSNRETLNNEATPIDSLSESDRELLSSISGLVSDTAILKKQLSALKIEINKVNIIIQNNSVKIKESRELDEFNYKSLTTELSETRKVLGLKYQDIQKKLTQKKTKKIKKIKKITLNAKKRKTKQIVKPQFELVSIDLWDRKEIILVSFNNSNQSLYLDDSFMGWKLITIKKQTGCVTFINEKKIKVNLCNKDFS